MTDDEDDLFRRLHDLAVAELDGVATPAQKSELKSLLRDEPVARRLYVEFIQDTAHLRWSFAHTTISVEDAQLALDPVTTEVWNGDFDGERPPTRLTIRWAAYFGIAASALIGAGVYLWTVFPRDASQPNDQPVVEAVEPAPTTEGVAVPHVEIPANAAASAEKVATLRRSVNAVWSGPGEVPEMSRLHVGQVVALDSGQVEMIFDSGVEVVLKGPAHFEIRSALNAYSRRGTISARVGPEGKGFTIDTPSARVVDLGTEFGIDVAADGDTEVAVFKGSVDLRVGAVSGVAAVRQMLEQGEAIRIGVNGCIHRIMSIASDRFPISAPLSSDGNPLEPIIGDVADSIRAGDSNKFYRIVRCGLREDSLAFGDRGHQWNAVSPAGLPLDLDGAEYVMPFNDDKFFSDLEILVTINRPANLYVFYSDSMAPPEWLKERFIDTGVNIGLDEEKSIYHRRYKLGVGAGESVDTVCSIWKQEIRQPGVVSLGAVRIHRRSAGYNMYGVAATPLAAENGGGQMQ